MYVLFYVPGMNQHVGYQIKQQTERAWARPGRVRGRAPAALVCNGIKEQFVLHQKQLNMRSPNPARSSWTPSVGVHHHLHGPHDVNNSWNKIRF